MKRRRCILLVLFSAVCAVFFFAAVSACGKVEKETSAYGIGEEGFYYYDGSYSSRYMLSLQSGKYMMTVSGDMAYSGSYTCDEKSGEICFTGDETFSAVIEENALSLDMTDSGYSFKAYKYFDVTYVDENGAVLATKSVLNGKSAEAIDIEKDGYWFIGWYEDANCSSEFAFSTSIAGDATLYGWYIEKNPKASDYVVTLDYGDGEKDTLATMNGAVWALPERHNDEDILGWWVSATGKRDELTYKYDEGDVFASDETLYAVYKGENTLGASVMKKGITWENKNAGANVSVSVLDSEGVVRFSGTTSSSTSVYSPSALSSLETGVYTVTVSAGAAAETLTYVVNGLDKVSKSSMDIITNGDGKIISFAPVENASGYMVTIDDGEKTVTEDLGSRTYYNLSSWEMTKEGLTITITAYADGFVSSVSDEYSYLLKLEKVTLEMSGDDFVWNRVDGALEYEVKIYGEDGDVLESFYTTETSYSLKYYDAGTYTISVKPVTSGYWSEETFIYGQSKSTIAAPVICDITDYTVSWTEVEDAMSYVVMINGTEYTVTGGATTLAFPEYGVPEIADSDSYEISVMAVADSTKGLDSSYSDTITATNRRFKSSVRYEKNTVYWDYDVSATNYVVSVNGAETTIEKGNSAEIALNKAGNNEIIVTAYSDEKSLGQAEIEVYAYTVTLDPNGANLNGEPVLYVAQGDVLNLGEVTKDHANFVSWYTQADYTDGQSDVYEGKGSEVVSGSVFTGSRDMYLYAYWTYEYMTITLDANGGTLAGDYDEETTFVKVKYGSSSFALPTPEPYGAEYDFSGWYDEKTDEKYADSTGKNLVKCTGDSTLRAKFSEVRRFTETKYDGDTVYAVSAGAEIGDAEELTIPETYNGRYLILNSGAFENCSGLKVINIPDTIRYVSVINGGYRSGTGAFAGCGGLEAVNVYGTEDAPEIIYYSSDGVLFRKTDEGCVEILYYPQGKAGAEEYRIPAEVSNENETDDKGGAVTMKVTSLPTQVFRDKEIETLIIPSTVTQIAGAVFSSDFCLKSVVFEEGGQDALVIADDAFQKCFALESVTFPARYTDFNGKMFDMCGNLAEVNIEEGGEYISEGGMLFSSDGLTIVYCPCGRGGEIDTSNLTDGVITRVGDRAFWGNTKITSVKISPTVTYIGEEAFSGCSALKTLTFEEGYSDLTIKENAFYGCSKISSLYLPSNLTVLEKDAFAGCANLSYVYFDSFVGATQVSLSFSAGAFGATNYISTLEFGPNVPEMDFENIFGSANINEIIVDSENQNYLTYDGAVYDAEGKVIRYYPLGRKGEYILYEGCEKIGADVFADRVNLTKITIGENVEEIASGAFYGCTYLTAIEVDEKNQRYSSVDGVLYAKENGKPTELLYCPMNNSKTELVVPETVTKVASYAFWNNSSVRVVTFEAETSFTLGSYAFYYASALETVNLPSCTTSIPSCAFYRCTSLLGDLSEGGTMKLPEGIKQIGSSAFYFCQNFACTIPSTVSSVGNYAFYYCWDSEVASAKIIFGETENKASSLTLGSYAFAYTRYATGVTIPGNVTSVGTYAFASLGSELENGAKVEIEEDGKLTQISERMFYNSSLTEMEIPEGVTEIGASSFRSTQMMTKVTIPSTVATIGNAAFYQSGLSDVEIADDSALSSVGNEAFYGSSVTSFVIPASVMSLGTAVFRGCEELTECEFEEGTTIDTIPQNTFIGCTALGSFEIPSSVLSIGSYAFSQCSSLEEISIPAGVTKIDTYAFEACSSLISLKFEDGSNIESFGNYSFANTSIKCFEFPEGGAGGLTLGGNLFSGCTLESLYLSGGVLSLGTALGGSKGIGSITVSVDNPNYEADENGKILYAKDKNEIVCVFGTFESVSIPDYIETIDAYAFECQSALIEVTIPAGVSSLGNYAFRNCTSLEKVTFEEGSALARGSFGTYVFYGCSSLEEVTLPDGLTRVPNYTFFGCTALREISLPSSVVQIGSYAFDQSGIETLDMSNVETVGASAFYGCEQLVSVTFSEKLTSLGADVFSMCSNLKISTLPGGITEIPADAFWRCAAIETFTVPSSVTTVGGSAFYCCVSLTEVMLPGGVAKISSSAFSGCEKLSAINIPSTVTEIGSAAFGNTAIKSVSVPYGLTSVPSSVFGGCENLSDVTIPDTVTSIGNAAFRGCESLEKIFVGTYVTEIGSNAFENCTSLKEITFGSYLEKVGTYAFSGCTSLESIEFNTLVSEISDYEFYGCTALKTVTIDKGVTSIGSQAFYGCVSLEYILIPSSVSSVDSEAFSGCVCPVYVESSANYVATNWGSWNGGLEGEVYHYSDSEPDLTEIGDMYDGNFWHYDETGNIVIWEYMPDVYTVEGVSSWLQLVTYGDSKAFKLSLLKAARHTM